LEIAALRHEDVRQRDLVTAWHTAAMTRMEKMPTLRELLNVPKAGMRRRQTPAEQREVLHQLSKRYGIPLKTKVH